MIGANENSLTEIEGKNQILMNEPSPMAKDNTPELDLFSGADMETGSAGEPEKGTRQ